MPLVIAAAEALYCVGRVGQFVLDLSRDLGLH